MRPIAIYDSEYGNASFVRQTAGIAADLLLRLRPNICLWVRHRLTLGLGRPKVHGDKFKLADKSTWGEPATTWEIEDAKWGTIQIQHWSGLHFRLAAADSLQVLRVTVSGKTTAKCSFKPMWLGWIGNEMPCLEQTWQCECAKIRS